MGGGFDYLVVGAEVIIGVDLDNTIISYDEVFRALAIEAELIDREFDGAKRALRDAIRSRPSGEADWIGLQAKAYGPGLDRATAFDGFAAFLERCRELGIPVYVVSHKSAFAAGDPAGVNLRDAAQRWLDRHFGSAFAGVYFEDDRSAKIARIRELECTHFVDDLEEVLEDADFPQGTARWHFAEANAAWPRVAAWIEDETRAWTAASALLGAQPARMESVTGGGNNRIYRVESDGTWLLKLYGVPDYRGRFDRETAALRFANGRNLPMPALIAADEPLRAALLEWIEGTKIGDASATDIDAALAFVARLHALRKEPGAQELSDAADAGLSFVETWRHLAGRVARLREVAELHPFLDRFEVAFARHRARVAARRDPDAELDAELRTLSPSDFGFHNAIRNEAGAPVFLDFEYFGWDDPVKLAADFVLHPAMRLSADLAQRWLDGLAQVFASDADFAARFEDAFPTYELKWMLILLNEFTAEGWARRSHAGRGGDRQAAQAAQLAKAQRLLDAVAEGRPFPIPR